MSKLIKILLETKRGFRLQQIKRTSLKNYQKISYIPELKRVLWLKISTQIKKKPVEVIKKTKEVKDKVKKITSYKYKLIEGRTREEYGNRRYSMYQFKMRRLPLITIDDIKNIMRKIAPRYRSIMNNNSELPLQALILEIGTIDDEGEYVQKPTTYFNKKLKKLVSRLITKKVFQINYVRTRYKFRNKEDTDFMFNELANNLYKYLTGEGTGSASPTLDGEGDNYVVLSLYIRFTENY